MQFAMLNRDASAAVRIRFIVIFRIFTNLVGLEVFHLVSSNCYYWWFLPQGAARRLATQKKNIEVVESVGVAGKSDFKRTVKYFRAEVQVYMLRIRVKLSIVLIFLVPHFFLLLASMDVGCLDYPAQSLLIFSHILFDNFFFKLPYNAPSSTHAPKGIRNPNSHQTPHTTHYYGRGSGTTKLKSIWFVIRPLKKIKLFIL